jgi:hypothetical protein
MSATSIPIISAMPQFGGPPVAQDDMAASSPIYQALLAQTGGNLHNTDAMAASQPGFGNSLSMMAPPGGLNPAQSAQFGPLFGLLMALNGQQGQGQPQGQAQGQPASL